MERDGPLTEPTPFTTLLPRTPLESASDRLKEAKWVLFGEADGPLIGGGNAGTDGVAKPLGIGPRNDDISWETSLTIFGSSGSRLNSDRD